MAWKRAACVASDNQTLEDALHQFLLMGYKQAKWTTWEFYQPLFGGTKPVFHLEKKKASWGEVHENSGFPLRGSLGCIRPCFRLLISSSSYFWGGSLDGGSPSSLVYHGKSHENEDDDWDWRRSLVDTAVLSLKGMTDQQVEQYIKRWGKHVFVR